MEIVILAEPADVARAAAAQVVDLVRNHRAAVLGLATGSSPLGVYEQLALQVSSGALDLSATRAFALDEYVGIPTSRVESYAQVIHADVVVLLNMNPDLVGVPDGQADDLQAARIKTLAPQTQADNARFFSSPDEVPTHCITQGLGTIMQARQIVLVAQGTAKAAAVAAAIGLSTHLAGAIWVHKAAGFDRFPVRRSTGNIRTDNFRGHGSRAARLFQTFSSARWRRVVRLLSHARHVPRARAGARGRP